MTLVVRWLFRSIEISVLLLATAVASCSFGASPEVRGTWLSTTGPNHIRTGINTEDVMSDLRHIGLNTVYVETWKNGYTNYPSKALADVTNGIDRNVPVIGSTRDLVQETLIHAHRNQLNYVGWFEYGFAAQFVGSGGTPSNPLATYMRDRGWLLRDQSGNYGNASNGFAWMNPAVPEVREFLIDITLEAVQRYDLDGIQFDDRLAWPREFGWDPVTLGTYQAETGNSLPTSVFDLQFRTWRQQKVSDFAAELSQAVRNVRPDIQLSVSPSVTGFSETNFNADWTDWQEDALFDEFVPQVYRSSISAFDATIGSQVAPFQPNDLEELIVGIRIDGSPPTTPYADVEDMIERTRREGAAGHSLWYSQGVRDFYSDQLTEFYDVSGQGHAANPNFAVDHRPAPLVASQAASAEWEVDVTSAGRYRLVAKIGNFWTEYQVAHLQPGTQQFSVPGATEVELLVDRRTASPLLADFDDDSDTDGSDLLAWQRGVIDDDTSVDANFDGSVDDLDFIRWQFNYGRQPTVSTASTLAVPEPATAMLLMCCALLGVRARCRSATD
ncbi:MAG: family 10 glycosylhydrolase [Planctomycetota bacterium]